MFWTILMAVLFARSFYSWGRATGFEEGKRYHAQRAEEMLRREQLRAILDDGPPIVGQRQPLRTFGRQDIRVLK